MKKLILLPFIIALFGCASSKIKPKLPEIVKCDETAKIYDQDSSYEINTLTSLESLSYATTYTRFSTKTDSLEKNEIRLQLANTSQLVALKVFPEIKITNSSRLLSQDYKSISKAVVHIKSGKANDDHFDTIIVPDEQSKLQLFIDIQSYNGDGIFNNYLSFYVIDTKKKELTYYDFIKYKCDIRDETMFMKTLYYGMNKLKNSIK